MFNNIKKYRNTVKMASSTMDTGYEAQGYATTTSNGNNATVSILMDTHNKYKKNITIKVDKGYEDYDEYYINFEDVYNKVKDGNVKPPEDNLFYKNCVSTNLTNHNYNNILIADLIKYITKCLNINENLTLNIIRDFPGTSTDMKIQAFNTMIHLVEKNQEVVAKDKLLQESLNAMDDYIQSLG